MDEQIPVQVIQRLINSPNPAEISERDAELLNLMPAQQVVPVLKGILRNPPDAYAESRAFDALLKLEEFDRVAFLIQFLDESNVDWRMVCCRRLGKINDSRAIQKLMDVVRNDEDPDVRYIAAEALGLNGGEVALRILQYVAAHDQGKDYEGFSVASAATQAIAQIKARLSSR